MAKDKKEAKKIVAIADRTYEIEKPKQLMQMAVILKNYIVKNKLYAPIAGKNYVMVEGWQFAGGLLGALPRIAEVNQVAPNKWLAKAEIINQKNQEVLSVGYALCSKEEMKKKTFDEYAILSMAQTRAIGKAYRNLIGWVIKAAGYESTPAEEVIKGKIEGTTPEQIQVDIEKVGNNPKIDELKQLLKGNTDVEKITDLSQKTGIKLKDFNITEKHASLIIATLLNLQVKNK